MKDLAERLRTLSEAINGCEWELPITAADDCLNAAALIDAKLHRRRCHDCGHEFYAADAVVPYCLCEKCKSQDTRRIKAAKAGGGE